MPVDPAPAAFVGAILAAVHAFDQAGVGAVLDEADATQLVQWQHLEACDP